jgi:hypothetical protein
MAINPLETINNKVVEQSAPSWMGADISGKPASGKYNPLYGGGGESQWTIAERARLKAIEAQKQGTLKALKQSELNAQNQYNVGSAMPGGQTQTGRRSLAEYLSQRGLTSSGSAVQGEIQALGGLQAGLGGLEATREGVFANIEAQRVAAEQEALNQQAELAQSTAERKLAEEQASRTQDLSAIQSGAYNQDVQAEINRRMAINPNDPTIPFLQAQRNQKLSGMASSQAEAEQQAFENRLALAKLNKPTSGGDVNTAYNDAVKEAVNNASTQYGWNQEMYDNTMSAYGFGSEPSAPIEDITSNEETQVANAVAQFSGGRISLSNLQKQLNLLGYKYNQSTKSVTPL